jgi:murein L,D-transpeptidase YcbB/YkuD
MKFRALALVFVTVFTPLGAEAAAADAVAEAIRARVETLRGGGDLTVNGEAIAARTVIPEFYERRDFRPAWTSPQQARALAILIQESRNHGLDPGDYHGEALQLMVKNSAGDPAALADRDLLLTDALVRFAYHLRFGKVDQRAVDPNWNFSRSLGDIDPAGALEAALAAPSLEKAVLAYAPKIPFYWWLTDGLARYRAIAEAGGWPRVPEGPTLKPGERDPRVADLRRRLRVTGDLTAESTDPELYDPVLEEAVKRFQERHGLEEDGAVGKGTLAELNVTVEERIDQIRINLDRARAVAQDIGGDYLIVDIAGYRAALFLGGKLAWSSRVVVGKPYRESPIFRAQMQYLVFNPTWTVPPTILRKDVLPKVLKNPAHLDKENMQLVDSKGRPVDPAGIDWSRYPTEPFPYQIVQDPGDKNALGRIKFMFPNSHAVYLHDTPSKRLFEKTQRAFSSGCIRVENPLALAELLLDDPEKWDAAAVKAAVEGGVTRTVSVKRKVPVMLLYWTAQMSEDGVMQFRRDLYGRDARMVKALAAPFRFVPPEGRR